MTHLELRNRMGDWMSANAVRLPHSVRSDILNIAQRELCRRNDMRYNEVLETFDTGVGTNAYTLPVTFSRPYEMQYLDPDSGAVVEPEYLPLNEFDSLYPLPTVTGKPKHYTFWKDQLYLGPTPNLVVTIHHAYYGYLADLVADGDHNMLTDRAWEILLFKALGDVHRYGIEDERTPVWIARGAELEEQMVREMARARSMGRRPVGREPS